MFVRRIVGFGFHAYTQWKQTRRIQNNPFDLLCKAARWHFTNEGMSNYDVVSEFCSLLLYEKGAAGSINHIPTEIPPHRFVWIFADRKL
jgi:hypothetical protein